jgi:hypothetical protein
MRTARNVERLIAAHGDAKFTDLLTTLADCDKAWRARERSGNFSLLLTYCLPEPTLADGLRP